MENLLRDLKFAVRVLWKDRGFTVTVLLTLAVCVGANAAIFAVVRSVLLEPLPFPDSSRVVLMYNSYPNAGAPRGDSGVTDYYDRRRDLTVFEQIALLRNRGVTVGSEGAVERLPAVMATPSFFDLLRTPAWRGRLFLPAEGEIGSDHEVILSHALWQRLFAGSDEALGKDLPINGVPHTIVGVMPAGFHFVDAKAQLWLPLAFTAEEKSDDARHHNTGTLIGRLKPGATLEQAQLQIDALNARNLERFPSLKQALLDVGFHTLAVPLQADLVRDLKPVLYLLWGGVLCVLLIGCVNIANLVLVRSSARLKELATRQSLGAGTSRIARQLLTETTLLTAGGGIAGLALGKWTLGVLAWLNPDELPRGSDIHMDAVVVAAILALALAIGLVIGLVPVANLRRLNLNTVLREEGRGGTSGRGARRARRALVTAQVAFAFVLLVGAGLLSMSFRKILAVDAGFEPRGVLTARISLPAARYQADSDLRAFAERALTAARQIPGVHSAGLTGSIPFGGSYSDGVLLPEGYTPRKGESLISPNQINVSDGYLEAMRTPLVRGRRFGAGDTAEAPPVVLVDERLARKFWPNRDPIGRRLYQLRDAKHIVADRDTRYFTVVGVMHDVKLTGLAEAGERFGACYFPFAQVPQRNFVITLETAGDPLALTGTLRRQVAAIDPQLPVYDVKTMSERLQGTLAARRVPMLLALGFASVALLLSALGIYGVLAYQVAQRRREIGIRMALGGTARSISRLVLLESVQMLAAGLGLGLGGALLVGRAMQSMLYGVQPFDFKVLAAVAMALTATALAAALLPARRAQRIDPASALNE